MGKIIGNVRSCPTYKGGHYEGIIYYFSSSSGGNSCRQYFNAGSTSPWLPALRGLRLRLVQVLGDIMKNDSKEYLEFHRQKDKRKLAREREIVEIVCFFAAVAMIVYVLCF